MARLRGLLGRTLEPGDGLLLAPCFAVHTAFMHRPIDVVFLDRGLRVLWIAAEVRPWRLVACRRAWGVLELPAGEAARRGLRQRAALIASAAIPAA
jgi:uncharacterized membrane protein (UPF0127 family)